MAQRRQMKFGVSLQQLDRLSTFVLAGGKGERLKPLTQDRAKPAVTFGGNYRIIDFTLSNCINSGIRRIHVLTQYKSMSLARHIRLGWNFLASEMREFIDILPAQQRYGDIWYRGTADAIYQNIYVITQERRDFVLILAGDHIYKMDYSKMLAFHLEKEADVTVGVVEMPIELAHQFGVLQVDRRGSILDFQEKPKNPSPVPGKPGKIYASMGIYIFNREVLLGELIQETENNNRHDFGKDILPEMLGETRMFAYRFLDENRRNQTYWRDIGTLDAFYEANMDLVSIDPQFNLYDDRWPIRTNQRLFPPAKTVLWEEGPGGRRGEAFNSLLSGGVIVSGGRVLRSILSPLVRINSHALVEDSVLMDGVHVGRGSRIRCAIIDKHVRIEPNTTIGWDLDTDRKRFTVTENGVVVIPRYRLIGPHRDEPLWVDPVDHYRQKSESGDWSKP